MSGNQCGTETDMEGARGVLDRVELSRLDDLVERVGFFDVVDDDIGELGRLEEIHKELSLRSRSH